MYHRSVRRGEGRGPPPLRPQGPLGHYRERVGAYNVFDMMVDARCVRHGGGFHRTMVGWLRFNGLG